MAVSGANSAANWEWISFVDRHTTFTRRHLIIAGAATLGAFAASIGVANQDHRIDNGGRIAIAATVGMITDTARTIGGEHVAATGLMGPSIDPHTYTPRASDIATLGDADIIFYGGLSLEGRMIETFEKIDAGGAIPAIAVGEAVPEELRLGNEDEAYAWDPHVWFDVSLWSIVAEKIAHDLTAIAPRRADDFAANLASYEAELAELDAWVFEQVERVPPGQRVLITAHDAFAYFGHRYGFDVLGVQGISTATEAGAGDIQNLADFITDHQIRAIFVETSVAPGTIEAVQAAVQAQGWNVAIGGELFADALGPEGTPEGTYVGMIRHNVSTIVNALLGIEEEG